MMKRSFLIALLILFFVVGCKGEFGKQKQPANQDLGTFVGGNRGIEIGFAEDQPPQAVLDDAQESFFITLLLRNVGEYTIEPQSLVASLSGVVQTSFSLSSLNVKNDFPLYAVGKDGNLVTPGAEDLLEFGEASFKSDLPGDTSFTLRADVCYPYQTKAVTKLCLKKDVLKKTFEDVCEVNNANLDVENSGAPVHVAVARQNSVGSNKVKVTFTVKNVGVGAIFEPGTYTSSCTGHEQDRDRLRVTVSNPENNFPIACDQLGGSNSGVVKFVNNEKVITCTITTSGLQEVTFQDLLIIQLDYIERLAITTPLRVTNALF